MRHDIQGTVYLLHFLEPIGNPTNCWATLPLGL
jgi:hypothetical protein